MSLFLAVAGNGEDCSINRIQRSAHSHFNGHKEVLCLWETARSVAEEDSNMAMANLESTNELESENA